MLSAVFAVLFGLTLLPGRKPLCMRFAERISGGITPEGAYEYCRRLTWVWFAILSCTTALAVFDWRLSVATPAIVALTFFVESRIRRRRFAVVFHTSGSSGSAKEIVKTFESLAREVAMHRDHYSEIARGATFLATVEPQHMYGTLWRVMLPNALGCAVDAQTILTPEALVAKMNTAGKVFLVTTPSFLSRFTRYAEQYQVPRNTVEIVTSGSMLDATTARRARDVFGVTPREIFGSTETGGVAWRRQIEGGEAWQVFDGVKVRCDEATRRLVVDSPFSVRRRWMMSDAVTLAGDGRKFMLEGRTDRRVKINELFVDLAAAEERIRALGWKDCALVKMETGRGGVLGALLAGAPTQALAEAKMLELRSAIAPAFEHAALPKRVRVVRELPRNAQGKVVAAEVASWLESSLAEPHIIEDVREASASEALVRFDGDAPYFRGHFREMPILPGVAQLGLAARWAAAISLGDATLRPRTVKRLKFSAIVRPGDTVRVRIATIGEKTVEATITKESKLCCSMQLLF